MSGDLWDAIGAGVPRAPASPVLQARGVCGGSGNLEGVGMSGLTRVCALSGDAMVRLDATQYYCPRCGCLYTEKRAGQGALAVPAWAYWFAMFRHPWRFARVVWGRVS